MKESTIKPTKATKMSAFSPPHLTSPIKAKYRLPNSMEFQNIPNLGHPPIAAEKIQLRSTRAIYPANLWIILLLSTWPAWLLITN